jgi:tetratricopeptide (TPR) repeat protein
LRKAFAVIAIIMLITCILSGCQLKDEKKEDNNISNFIAVSSSKDIAGVETGEYAKRVDKLIKKYAKDAPKIEKHPFMTEFEKADALNKVDMALGLADDMAMSCVFDLESDTTFKIAAEVVKTYPHPLLLNNFGAMLAEKSPEDSLFFFLQALDQDPDNPVILVNAAYLYIEMDNFTEAENCAKNALLAAPDYGPAYQILTTIHLKNEDYILAAETMVKSAKHFFNDITIHHFDSFLEAVAELDPEVDEYPLQEEFIKELYMIAKENVDTNFVREGLDTPEAQLTLKPFPKINELELESMQQELFDMQSEILMEHDSVRREYYNYQYAVEDYLNEPSSAGNDIYPFKKNLRQIYAFKVLQSYYNFKLKKCALESEKKIMKFNEEASEREFKIMDELNERQASAQDSFDYNVLTPMRPEDLFEIERKAMEEYKLALEEIKKVYNSYTPEVISLSREQYNETKQILEEFWLRSGGIIKYITEEDILKQFDYERTMTVYEYIEYPIGNLLLWAGNLVGAETVMFYTDEIISILNSLGMIAEDYENIMSQNEAKEKGDDMIPDIEKQAITHFEEEGDLPDVGFEGDIFGFGASLQTDGERLKVGLETPVSSSEISKNLLYDKPSKGAYFESYTAVGAKAQGSTDWFTDFKNVKKAIGKGQKIMGDIGFGFSNNVSQGNYVSVNKEGKIVDRGIIYIRESGGSIGKFGKSERVVVRKSTMTGLAIKEKSTKYKFGIGSFTVGR